MKDYMKDRLAEPSTWRGLAMLAAGLLGLGAGATDAVIAIGVAISGLIGVTTRG